MTKKHKARVEFILKKMRDKYNVSIATGGLSDHEIKEMKKIFSIVRNEPLGYTYFQK